MSEHVQAGQPHPAAGPIINVSTNGNGGPRFWGLTPGEWAKLIANGGSQLVLIWLLFYGVTMVVPSLQQTFAEQAEADRRLHREQLRDAWQAVSEIRTAEQQTQQLLRELITEIRRRPPAPPRPKGAMSDNL